VTELASSYLLAAGNNLTWREVLVLAIFTLGVLLVLLLPFTIDVVMSHRTYQKLAGAHPATAVRADEPHGMQGLARASMAFAVIAVVGFALAYILVRQPFVDNKTITSNILVALTTTLASITAFYFGSRLASQAHQDATTAAVRATKAAETVAQNAAVKPPTSNPGPNQDTTGAAAISEGLQQDEGSAEDEPELEAAELPSDADEQAEPPPDDASSVAEDPDAGKEPTP
jgi:hypothetical protein